MSILQHAKPLTEVLRDERTNPRIRKLLAEIPAVKAFGERHGLKPTTNYTEYVKLDRPAAVWVVSASERLRFKSKEWSFPFIGHVPYLGWFDLKSAQDFARELEGEGLDVDLRGAGAYSTLGWFRDPVLSSMIAHGEEARGELVNVVLHESVHATFYIAGQAYFNESLASFVADRLTDSYFNVPDAADLGKEADFLVYRKAREQSELAEKKFRDTYLRLKELYDSAKSDQEKFTGKAGILKGLREELQLKRDVNNATLIQFEAYNTDLADFEAVYRACGADWQRFWGALRTISEKNFSESQQSDVAKILAPLKVSCGSATRP